MPDYLREAFAELRTLNEDDFEATTDERRLQALDDFFKDDIEAPVEEPIIDLDAEDEGDLQVSYEGKVILECDCCHTRVYKNEDEIVIDEETGLANVEDVCPVCEGTFGYHIIGKIQKFEATSEKEEDEDEVEDEEKPEEAEVEDETEEEEDETDKALKEAFEYAFSKYGGLEGFKARRLNLDTDDIPDDGRILDEQLTPTVTKESLNENWDENVEDEVENESALDVCPKCGKTPCVCKDEDCTKDEGCTDCDEGCTKNESCTKDESCDKDEELLVEEEAEEDTTLEESQDVDAPEALKEDINIDMNSKIIESNDEADIDMNTNTVHISTPNGNDGLLADDETIAPLSPEEEDQFKTEEPDAGELPLGDEVANEPLEDIEAEPDFDETGEFGFDEEPIEGEEAEAGLEEIEPTEGPEAEEEPEEEEELTEGLENFENLETESFDYLCNCFARKIYENVESYRTTKVAKNNGALIIEGKHTFKNGGENDTRFVFEDVNKLQNGKFTFTGHNNSYAENSPKAFKLLGTLSNKNFISEALKYNYKVNTLNEAKENISTRVKGVIFKK